ncbi:MAG: ABC transporter substrate-binding protein, partial [Rubrivivax sp.]|nr:ABC transporter substrate-binding protein [Pyrinomonadaceae bacterium]
MSERSKLFAACLALAAACYLFAGARAGGASVQSKDTAAGQARALTAQERRGKSIYTRGVSASGGEVTATIGELDVPGSTMACAGCHGARGEGMTEGGITAGNVTWSDLTKPAGHAHSTVRRHGPFDEKTFARSMAEGVDPAGNDLLIAMPRYRMSPEDVADLVAYIKRVETDRDPGITDDTIRVGTTLPTRGPLAEAGAAMRDVLMAYFDDVNSRGGIYNRKIELRVAEMGDNASATAARARGLVEREQVFALVGGLSAGADAE